MNSPRSGGNYYPPLPQREQVTKNAAFAINATGSSAVDVGGFASGMFWLPAEFNGDAVTVTVSNESAGSYSAPYHNGAAAEGAAFTAVQNTWNVIPEAAFSAGFIKLTTNAAVTAAATVPFSLKT